MIAKINIGSNLYGALAYNQEKVNEGKGKILGSNLVFEPANGQFNIYDCMNDFMRFIPSHFRTEKPVFHVSINPHPNDKLTDSQLTDIGREYMEKLGYGNQPYLVFKHEDIEREHIHIVSLRVDYNGKKIDDYNEHIRSKEITEQLERKYTLHPGEGQKTNETWELTPVDASKGNLKKQITSVIKPVAAMYHFQSIGEYKAVLSLYNIHVEELRGEINRKAYRGLLYSALDDKGNKTGTPLKSSLFGKTVGYSGLEKRMVKSKERIKNQKLKAHTLEAVRKAKAGCRNEKVFRANLKKQGIDVLFRQNDDGRIYGATFIDHTTRTVLNGSRLGKEFSANVFNKLYGNEQSVSEENIIGQKSETIHADSFLSESNLPGGIFSIFNPEPEKYPDEYVPWLHRRKKKKRRYGRQT